MLRPSEMFSDFDNLRNLAHVFLDGEIGGTPLEGSHLELNIHYLQSFLEWIQTIQTDPLAQSIQNAAKASLQAESFDKLNALLRRLQDIAAIEEKINQLPNQARRQAHLSTEHGYVPDSKKIEVAQQLLLNLATEVMEDYKKKGDIFMPGGWAGEVGHQMIYRLTREESGKVLLRIYNGGAGIDYHGARISDKGVKYYYPVFGMRCDENILGLAKLTAKLFSFLVIPQLDCTKKFNAADIYDKTLGVCFEWLNAEWVPGAELFDKSKSPRDMLVSSSLSGICVFKAISFIIRQDFVNKSTYRQFILAYRMYLLNNAMQNMNGLTESAGDAPRIVERCLANTARMLDQQLKPYIAEWKVTEEEKHIFSTQLDNWQSSLIAMPSKPIDKIEQPTSQKTDIRYYTANAFSPLQLRGDLDSGEEQKIQHIKFNPKYFLVGLQELAAIKSCSTQDIENFCLTYTDTATPLLTQEVKNPKEVLDQLTYLVDEYTKMHGTITPRKVVFSLSLIMIMERLCGERLFKYNNEHLSPLGLFTEKVMPDFLKTLLNNPLLANLEPQLDRQWQKLNLYFTQEAYKVKQGSYFNENYKKSWIQYYIHLIELGPAAEKKVIKEKWERDNNTFDNDNPLSENQRQAVYDFFTEKHAHCYSFLHDTNMQGTPQLTQIFALQNNIENFYCKNLMIIANSIDGGTKKYIDTAEIKTYFVPYDASVRFTHGLDISGLTINPAILRDLYSFKTQAIYNALSSHMDNNHYNSHEISSRTPGTTYTDREIQHSVFPYDVPQLRGRSDEARAEGLLHQLLLSPNTQISAILTELLQHPTWLNQVDHQCYIEVSLFQPQVMLQTLKYNPAIIKQLNDVLNQTHFLKDPSYPESAEWYVLNLCIKVGIYALSAEKNQWITLSSESREVIQSWMQIMLTAINLRLQQSGTPDQYRSLYAIKYHIITYTEIDSEKAFSEGLLSYVLLILLPKPSNQTLLESEREGVILQQGLNNLIKSVSLWSQNLNQVGAKIIREISFLDPFNPLWKEKWGYQNIDLESQVITLINENQKILTINLYQKTLTIDGKKMGYLPPDLILNSDYQNHFGQQQQLTIISEKYYESVQRNWRGDDELDEKSNIIKKLELSHTFYTWNIGDTQWRYAVTHRNSVLQKYKGDQWYTLTKLKMSENYSDILAFSGHSIPKLLDQINYEIWVADSKNYWIQDLTTQAIVYQLQNNTMERIQEPSGKLIQRNIPLNLLRIESQSYIECIERPDKTIIWNLPRYQLTFREEEKTGNIYTADNRHILLIPTPEQDIFGSGVILRSSNNQVSDEYLVPLQLFYQGESNTVGAHYKLIHDTSNYIKQKDTSLEKKLWDFNGTETIVRYHYKNEKIQLKNTPAADLIYLAYLYLIQEQPEKAFRILSKCQLQANVDELKRLSWLVMHLPVGDKRLESSPIVTVQLLALHHIMTITQQDPTLINQLESKLTIESRTKIAENAANAEIKAFVRNLANKMVEIFLYYDKAKNNIPKFMRLKPGQIAKILSYCHSNASGCLEILGAKYFEYYGAPNEIGITTYSSMEPTKGETFITFKRDFNIFYTFSSIYEVAKSNFTETNFAEVDQKLNPWMSEEEFWNIFPDLFELAIQKKVAKDRLILCLKTTLAIDKKVENAISSGMQKLIYLLLCIAQSSNPNVHSVKQSLKERMRHLPSESALNEAKAKNNNLTSYEYLPQSNSPSINIMELENDLRNATHDIMTAIFRSVYEENKDYIYGYRNNYPRYKYDALVKFGYFDNITLRFEINPPQVPSHVRSLNDLTISEIKTDNVFLDSIYNDVVQKLKPLQSEFDDARADVIQELKKIDNLYLEEQEAEFQRLDNKLLKEQNKIQAQQKLIYQEKRPALLANKDKISNIILQSQMTQKQLADKIAEIINRRNRLVIQELGKQIPLIDLKFLLKNYTNHSFSDWEALGIQKQDLQDLKFTIDDYLHAHDTEKRLSLLLKGLAEDNPIATINALLSKNESAHKHEAIFQYIEKLALRPSQARMLKLAIENPDILNSQVLQLIMGGGKTKVLMPLLLFLFADGKNLPVAIFPEMLLNTNFCDVRATSMKVFDQDAFLLHFDRTSPSKENDLMVLYEKILSTIREKSYIVTDSSSMKSLELKHKELLYLRSQEEEKLSNNDQSYREKYTLDDSDDEEEKREEKPSVKPQSPIDKRIELLRKILHTLATKSIGLVDEAHQLLHIMKEMNYSIGTPRHIDPTVIEFISQLYEWLNITPISNLLPDRTITFRYLIENPNIIPDDATAIKLMRYYIDQLMQYGTQPAWLQDVLIEGLFINDIKNYLLMHLTNYESDYTERRKLDEMIYNKLSKHPQALTKLLLLREELSVLLPLTLQKKLHENYGPNPEDLGNTPGKSNSATSCARPYRANNTPSPYVFASFMETFNYTAQMIYCDGIFYHEFIRILTQWKELSLSQREQSDSSLQQVPIYDIYFNNVFPESGYSIATLNLNDSVLMQKLYDLAKKNPFMIAHALPDILSRVQFDPYILRCDSLNFASMLYRIFAFSGTPSNYRTFHSKVNMVKETGLLIESQIKDYLNQKQTPIIESQATTDDVILNSQLLIKQFLTADKNANAFIDCGGLMRGVTNLQVANIIRIHPNLPSHIKHILFYQGDALYAISTEKNHDTPIKLSNTDPNTIEFELAGCKPHERITYYDQEHTIGSDILQSPNCCGVATLDIKTGISAFLQAVARLRALSESQTVVIICPSSVMRLLDEHQLLKSLFLLLEKNQRIQLQMEHFRASVKKIRDLYRADIDFALLSRPHSEAAVDLFKAGQNYFIEEQVSDIIAMYKQRDEMQNTSVIMENYIKQQHEQWRKVVFELCKYYFTPEELTVAEKRLQDQTALIAEQAIKICSPQYAFPSPQWGTEMQQEKQVENEKKKELKKEQENQFGANTFRLININYQWLDNLMKLFIVPEIKKQPMLTQLLETEYKMECSPNLYASNNFLYYYEKQRNTEIYSLESNPALTILWMSDVVDLYALIMTQEESDKLAAFLFAKPSDFIWISTIDGSSSTRKPELSSALKSQESLLIEQLAFLTGRVDVLTRLGHFNWFETNKSQKLDFFARVIKPAFGVSEDQMELFTTSILSLDEHMKEWANPHSDLALTRDWINQLPKMIKNRFNAIYPYLDELRSSVLITGKKYDESFFAQKNILAEDIAIILKYQDELLQKHDLMNSAKYILRDPNRRLYFLFSAALTDLPNNLQKGITALQAVIELDPKLKWTMDFAEKLAKYSNELSKKPVFYQECLLYLLQLRLLNSINLDQLWQNNTWDVLHVLLKANIYNTELVKEVINNQPLSMLVTFVAHHGLLQEKTILNIIKQTKIPLDEIYHRVNYLNQMQTRLLDIDAIVARHDFWEAKHLLEEMKADNSQTMQRVMDMPFTIDIFKHVMQIVPHVKEPFISNFFQLPVENLMNFIGNLSVLKSLKFNMDEFTLNKLTDPQLNSALATLFHHLVLDVPLIQRLFTTPHLPTVINFAVQSEWFKKEEDVAVILCELCDTKYINALSLFAKANINSTILLKELANNPSLMQHLNDRYNQSSEHSLHPTTLQRLEAIKKIISGYEAKAELKSDQELLKELSDKAISLAIYADHEVGKPREKEYTKQLDQLYKTYNSKFIFNKAPATTSSSFFNFFRSSTPTVKPDLHESKYSPTKKS